jgi:hypothetical protein
MFPTDTRPATCVTACDFSRPFEEVELRVNRPQPRSPEPRSTLVRADNRNAHPLAPIDLGATSSTYPLWRSIGSPTASSSNTGQAPTSWASCNSSGSSPASRGTSPSRETDGQHFDGQHLGNAPHGVQTNSVGVYLAQQAMGWTWTHSTSSGGKLRNRRSQVRILSGALHDSADRAHLQGLPLRRSGSRFVARKLVSGVG